MYKILPSKHVQLSKTIYGISGIILKILLGGALTLEECWKHYNINFVDKEIVKYRCSFDYFVLAIDFLYMMGSLNISSEGVLFIETN